MFLEPPYLAAMTLYLAILSLYACMQQKKNYLPVYGFQFLRSRRRVKTALALAQEVSVATKEIGQDPPMVCKLSRSVRATMKAGTQERGTEVMWFHI